MPATQNQPWRRGSTPMDVANVRFGRLTAVKRTQWDNGSSKWLCKCDCGKEKEVRLTHLRSGLSLSCGCLRLEKLRKKVLKPIRRGKKFGRLTVLGDASPAIGPSMSECRCSCGKVVTVKNRYLRIKRTQEKSCGCRNKLPAGYSARNAALSSIKQSAKIRNYAWDLEDEVVFKLMEEPCYLCGQRGGNNHKNSRSNGGGSYRYNGLDRLDNSLGYVMGNVAPCCGQCNLAKGRAPLQEFLSMCARITKHQKQKR